MAKIPQYQCDDCGGPVTDEVSMTGEVDRGVGRCARCRKIVPVTYKGGLADADLTKFERVRRYLGAIEVRPRELIEHRIYARRVPGQKPWQIGRIERRELGAWQWAPIGHAPAWWSPEERFACIGCDADEEATPLPGTRKVYETYATLKEAQDAAAEDPDAFLTYDGRIVTVDLATAKEVAAA